MGDLACYGFSPTKASPSSCVTTQRSGPIACPGDGWPRMNGCTGASDAAGPSFGRLGLAWALQLTAKPCAAAVRDGMAGDSATAWRSGGPSFEDGLPCWSGRPRAHGLGLVPPRSRPWLTVGRHDPSETLLRQPMLLARGLVGCQLEGDCSICRTAGLRGRGDPLLRIGDLTLLIGTAPPIVGSWPSADHPPGAIGRRHTRWPVSGLAI